MLRRLMHKAHKMGNTSGVSKSSSDWLSSTGVPGYSNHILVMSNPLMEDGVFTTVTRNAHRNQLNAEFYYK